MNRRTIDALNRINRRFYSKLSEEFSCTRKNPWPGWTRFVSVYQQYRVTDATGPRLSILDVGCGNGRFLAFTANRLQQATRYLGVDMSLPLLAEARGGAVRGSRIPAVLVATDLTSDRGLQCLKAECSDLVVAFGLLHHIPGRQLRQRLLSTLASFLAPNGVLAVSFWQFGDRERFLRRTIPWADYNRFAEERIDPDELEEGDMLLAWGEMTPGESSLSGRAARYCHFADAAAASQLVESLQMRTLARFFSDGRGGRQNLYYVLVNSPGPASS
jgi:tRNA (uracil-5-)-methyltransferase TRM9